MALKSRSIVLEGPKRMVLKEFPLPKIGPDEFLLKVEMVGICGGDPIEYEGRNKKTRFPLILGHEVVGRIAEIGHKAAEYYGVKVGDRVTVEPYIICGKCYYCLNGLYQFCQNSRVYGVNVSCDTPPHLWGAYSEYLYGAPGARVHLIKPEIPAEAACMSAVLGNGVRWVRRLGGVRFGEAVVILGPGAQGLASVIAAKEAGAHPIIVVGKTRNPRKWELAREYGADYNIDITVQDPIAAVSNITNKGMAEVVIETTGAAHMMELALELARPAGRVIMVGTCGFEQNPLTTDLIVFKELRVIGGLGQSWDTETAVSIINSRKYAVEKMVTHVYPLNQAEEALKFYMNNTGEAIRVAIKP
ncbi:zinc-binding dehydrogenase [Moorellaceae bacterium AZ2]|uniref:zinc-dependent alcohol dehydrogenase n=1 Tax=Thermanaeromonas sp. C210 TaxID=2731925 RepID=UPI00155CFC3E|nr:zinc-binding dehydrogenase [Thermanaeromonas sp. C210]GFN22350.1 alcohol dehydrogenase [Thermanaeromonas sp. C210]